MLTDIVLRLPVLRPVDYKSVVGTVVRRGIDGPCFGTCRRVHFLDQCRDIVGFAIILAALEHAREFAGYWVCGQQNAGLERLQAESIFAVVDVVFYERRIAVIEREMLFILGLCIRNSTSSRCAIVIDFFCLDRSLDDSISSLAVR